MLAAQPPRAIILDPATLTRRATVELPTLALEMAVDAKRHRVLTAQTTPPGTDAPGRLGTIDLSGRPALSLLDLPAPGADKLAIAGDWGLVTHSYLLQGGMVGERFAAAGPSIEATAQVAVTRGAAAVGVGDEVWLDEHPPVRFDSATAARGGAPSTERIRAWARTGEPRVVTEKLHTVQLLTGDGHRIFALLGKLPPVGEPAGPPTEIVELSPTDGRVLKRGPLDDLSRRAGAASVASDTIALTSYEGLDPNEPGDQMVLLDAETLAERARAEGLPGPAGVATDGARVWVGCVSSGEVVLLDADTGKVSQTPDCVQHSV